MGNKDNKLAVRGKTNSAMQEDQGRVLSGHTNS